jgi:hypothetical protein
MALETNADIPTPYVYQAADIGGKIENVANKKDAKLRYELEQRKANKAKGDVALSGLKLAKADLTPSAIINEAIQLKADKITDIYSEWGSQELPIWDATTPAGKALQSDINDLKSFQAQMADVSKKMEGINGIKGADNDVYNYFHDKIMTNPTVEGIRETIEEYNNSKDLLTAIPKVTDAVTNSVGAAGLDVLIEDLKKADFSSKKSDEILTLTKEINETKIPAILANLNSNPEIQKARGIFDFKKEKGIFDKAQYGGFEDFDEYLKDLVLNQVDIKGVSADVYKDPKAPQNITVKINNTQTTPVIGQAQILPATSIANNPIDFNSVNYDLTGGTTNGTISIKKKDGSAFTKADVDAMNQTISSDLSNKYIYSLEGDGSVKVNSDVLGLSADQEMTITDSLASGQAMKSNSYKNTKGETITGKITSVRHTASGDLVGVLEGGDPADLNDDIIVFLWSDKPTLKNISKNNSLLFANQLNSNVANPDMWTFWQSSGTKFK